MKVGIYFGVFSLALCGLGLSVALDGRSVRHERELLEREGTTVAMFKDPCAIANIWSGATPKLQTFYPVQGNMFFQNFEIDDGLRVKIMGAKNLDIIMAAKNSDTDLQVRYLPADPHRAFLIGSARPPMWPEYVGYGLALLGVTLAGLGLRRRDENRGQISDQRRLALSEANLRPSN